MVGYSCFRLVLMMTITSQRYTVKWSGSSTPLFPMRRLVSIALPRVVWARYRNINLLLFRDWQVKPSLRSRLTLARRPLTRNPGVFGGTDSHRTCATTTGISTLARSTGGHPPASAQARRLHTPHARMRGLGYRQLAQPRPFSEPEDLIGKLLRTSWRVAVSEPTCQLSVSSDIFLFNVWLAFGGLNPS